MRLAKGFQVKKKPSENMDAFASYSSFRIGRVSTLWYDLAVPEAALLSGKYILECISFGVRDPRMSYGQVEVLT